MRKETRRLAIEPTYLNNEVEGEDEEEIVKDGNWVFALGEQV